MITIQEALKELNEKENVKKTEDLKTESQIKAKEGNWEVYRINSNDDARKFSEGTRWYITDPSYFDRHIRAGFKLYIFINTKHPEEKYLYYLLNQRGSENILLDKDNATQNFANIFLDNLRWND